MAKHRIELDLQGISEATLLVLYAAHEKEAEGLCGDSMAFMHNFLEKEKEAYSYQGSLFSS